MTRNELVTHLSSLENFHLVTDEIYAELGYHRKPVRNYRADIDPRLRRYFEYETANTADRRAYLTYTALAIVLNLSVHCMEVPSAAAMSQLLQIAGYSSDQMETYVQELDSVDVNIVPSYRLAPVVFLLSRVLSEAMLEMGMLSKGAKKGDLTSFNRLQRVCIYMQDNGILNFLYNWDDCADTQQSDPSDYDLFVYEHAENMLKRAALNCDTEESYKVFEKKMEQIHQRRIRELKQAMERQMRTRKANAYAGKTVRKKGQPAGKTFLPLANPSVEDAAGSLLDTCIKSQTSAWTVGQNELPEELAMEMMRKHLIDSEETNAQDLASVDRLLASTMPPELQETVCWSDEQIAKVTMIHDQILACADELYDALDAKDEAQKRVEYMPSIAEAAFQVILSGQDEIFRLRIGRYIWQDFMNASCMPLPVMPYKTLSDENEWDYLGTETNGRLALKIYDEDDLISVRVDPRIGIETIKLTIATTLANYAHRPVEPHLYLRKSHIRLFKEAGYSDRRARDFAVVLATLAGVDSLESGELRMLAGKLYDLPALQSHSKADDEQIIDEHIRKLEQELKQTSKENQANRHEISLLEREVNTLRRENAALRERMKAAAAYAESTNVAVGSASPADSESIAYPYRTKLRVVVYGGFETFHRELQRLIPGIRVVEAASHIDTSPVKKADIVFLQINKTDHSGYWSVCDACKAAGVRYIHLNYASARKCAEVMVEEIRKMEGLKSGQSQSR